MENGIWVKRKGRYVKSFQHFLPESALRSCRIFGKKTVISLELNPIDYRGIQINVQLNASIISKDSLKNIKVAAHQISLNERILQTNGAFIHGQIKLKKQKNRP